MQFESHLSDDDLRRAAAEPMTPPVITGAKLSQLNAIEALWTEVIHPFVHSHDSLPIRQLAFAAIGDRMIGHARVVPKLNSLVYQQSVTAAERSLIELWLDLQILHLNIFPDGPERIFAFAEYQKLLSARRTVQFFAEHPVLDRDPTSTAPHRRFIQQNAARIDEQTHTYWGKPTKGVRQVEHWSSLKLKDRAKAVGSEAQLLVIYGYDMRNFSVHSGISALVNVPPGALELIHVQSVGNVAQCMMDALRVLGKELAISKTIEPYDAILDYLDDVPSYSATDAILRSKGEPQRYFFKPGPWSVVDERPK
jgi:hypothetical protein